ncbi:MAG: SEC-C metal-binding domain-containing protein [Thermodesulfobacteriota bacterium]|nr:SEC-C metal-binding domain-containing protein [Thermodesulfobacteriota bacterium]
MKNMNIGRNDPCPCGSGKKYKECCLGREDVGPLTTTTADVFAEMRKALEEQEFASLEEAQAFAECFIYQSNQSPNTDFHGISPAQMHRFLNFPLASPQLVTFPETLGITPAAPILSLFGLLAEAIGEQGLKPTAKGNLPQKLCREAALSYWGEETYRHNTRFGGINKEEDFFDLHVTRLVAELAGLIRNYKGRFILSRDCRSLLADSGLAGTYPRLLRAYVEKFNWGYWDRYPDINFIQHSFLFTLYLLTRYGDACRPQVFYEDCFLRAFPMVLNEIEPSPVFTPEQEIRSCYTLRALVHFARFLGLAAVEPATNELYVREYRVKKLPLLHEAVRFHLQE